MIKEEEQLMFMKNEKDNKSKVDFLNKEFIQNPFLVYKNIRENDPVHQFLLPNGQFAWIVTTFKEASKVLSDSRFVTNSLNQTESANTELPPHQEIISRNLLSVDPSDHRRLRRLIQKVFTPRMVEKLRGRVEEIANQLLDQVEDKGKMDLFINLFYDLLEPKLEKRPSAKQLLSYQYFIEYDKLDYDEYLKEIEENEKFKQKAKENEESNT